MLANEFDLWCLRKNNDYSNTGVSLLSSENETAGPSWRGQNGIEVFTAANRIIRNKVVEVIN